MKLTTVAGFLAVTLVALHTRTTTGENISNLDGPDFGKLGKQLNALLVLLLQIPTADDELIPVLLDKIDQVIAKVLCFINGLPMAAQDHMYLLLSDLFAFVVSLQQNPLQALFQEGTQIFFIIVDLLENFETSISPDVFLGLSRLLAPQNFILQ